MSYPGGKRQHGAHRTSSSTSAIRSGGGRSKEEEDFQKAIAASLLDVGSGASSTSGPAFELRNPPPKDSYSSSYSRSAPTQSYGPSSNEPDDPELAAAIAASLRDLAPPASAPRRESYGSRYATNSGTYYPEQRSAPPVPRYAPLPTYDLSSSESNSLENFSASVLEGPNAGQRMGERERMLYEKARSAVPRLERGLEDASRRREILVEMNEKLGEATRLYEGMLEERVRGASERVAGESPTSLTEFQSDK
jgi:growth factor-regulated tyrosine kinase substrate